MLLSQAALGQLGIWLMLIATLLTAVMTFNGGFATASRFLYATAREDSLPQIFARISIAFAVPYFAVIFLTVTSAAIAVIIFLTGQFNALILLGAVLEALIYTVAGICVLRLRRKQPHAERAFRIRGGWTIPILTIVIFGALAILASLGIGSNIMPGLPLIITIGVFLISSLYVFLWVPRIRAAAQARRAATKRRRPTREVTSRKTGQG
ncbi:MAG: hypothetical protein NVS3B14_07950 [Ktedonobacteraceae bacterium]